MSSPDPGTASDKTTLSLDSISIAERLAVATQDPAMISEEALGALLAATVRLYAARYQQDPSVRPFGRDGAGVTATDVMVATTAMLQALHLQLFELGMWQAWTGTRSGLANGASKAGSGIDHG
jgi:hypothetical protein